MIAIKIETANFQLITNWHLVIPSQSRDVCTYILYYIFIYINTIVKSFCSFPLFFFPPLPCLLFPICSSSDKYCFVFIFIFIYIQMELKHSACLRLWLTMKRAHCSNRPSLCPLFLSCCLVILSPLRYLLPLVSLDIRKLYILRLGTDIKLSHYFPISLPIRLMWKWSMNIVFNYLISYFTILVFNCFSTLVYLPVTFSPRTRCTWLATQCLCKSPSIVIRNTFGKYIYIYLAIWERTYTHVNVYMWYICICWCVYPK